MTFYIEKLIKPKTNSDEMFIISNSKYTKYNIDSYISNYDDNFTCKQYVLNNNNNKLIKSINDFNLMFCIHKYNNPINISETNKHTYDFLIKFKCLLKKIKELEIIENINEDKIENEIEKELNENEDSIQNELKEIKIDDLENEITFIVKHKDIDMKFFYSLIWEFTKNITLYDKNIYYNCCDIKLDFNTNSKYIIYRHINIESINFINNINETNINQYIVISKSEHKQLELEHLLKIVDDSNNIIYKVKINTYMIIAITLITIPIYTFLILAVLCYAIVEK